MNSISRTIGQSASLQLSKIFSRQISSLGVGGNFRSFLSTARTFYYPVVESCRDNLFSMGVEHCPKVWEKGNTNSILSCGILEWASGASKVVQVIAAIGVRRFLKAEWPKLQWFGNSRKFPGLTEWIVLVGISVAVNVVLYAWSRISNSTGTHKGVDRMVSSTKDRNCLTPRERLLYGSLALINATCEEVSFRWFWRSEFVLHISDRQSNQENLRPSDYFRFDSNFAGFSLSRHPQWLDRRVLDFCVWMDHGRFDASSRWRRALSSYRCSHNRRFLPIFNSCTRQGSKVEIARLLFCGSIPWTISIC